MKKIICLILSLLTIFCFAACKSEDSGKILDYNLDEYITLPSYDILTIDKNGNEYKMGLEYANYSNIQNTGATFEHEELTEGVVKANDTVNIDYVGKKDGVAFEGGTAKGYDLTIGSSSFIEGFELGLIGVKVGDTVDLNLTFPENYNATELAGKDVVFTVTVNSISRPVMPKMTDELIKKLGFATENEYKENLEKTYLSNFVWTKTVRNTNVIKYPQKEIEQYIDANVAAISSDATSAGVTLEEYLSTNGLTEALYREYLVDYARSFILQKMVFYSIARKEGIEVSDSELKKLLEEAYGSDDVTEDDKNWVYEKELQQRVCEFLISKAKIS